MIIAVLAAAIVFAAIKIIRDKRNGKGCGGNCADCGKSCSTKSKRK
ncbi:MAG TPA: FeoB-associated Cys-rich membrane protein [Ruminococcaceae bacterium]|nr:FeoB-associated Cys-rich membrane protein [Oscillospiraceae bacterium]